MALLDSLKNLFAKKEKTAEERAPKIASPIRRFYVRYFYFTTTKRVRFYENVKTLVQAGVSLQTIISMLSKLTLEYDRRNKTLHVILDDILENMNQGLTYEQALGRWIPQNERLILRTAGKRIQTGCEVLASFAQNLVIIRSALSSALIYPIFLVILMIVISFFFSYKIMPALYTLSPPDTWPFSAQILDSYCKVVRDDGLYILLGLGGFTAFTMWSLNNLPHNLLRRILDFIPPWLIYKRYQSTAFLLVVSSLIKTGVSYNYTIQVIMETASKYLRSFLERIQFRLSKGNNFGESLGVGLLPSEIIIDMVVFSVTNRLDVGIKMLAEENIEKQKKIIVNSGKVFGLIMMAMVSLFIGWVVFATYGIQSSIQS